MKVGRNRVWAKMREMGLVLAAPHERDPDAPRGQVVTAESNRRWATDLTTVWTKHDGLVAVIPVIDCGDRVLLEAVRAWMHKYNHARPHQALKWRTPAEERAAKISGRMATAA